MPLLYEKGTWVNVSTLISVSQNVKEYFVSRWPKRDWKRGRWALILEVGHVNLNRRLVFNKFMTTSRMNCSETS